jgi:hypothetical protein
MPKIENLTFSITYKKSCLVTAGIPYVRADTLKSALGFLTHVKSHASQLAISSKRNLRKQAYVKVCMARPTATFLTFRFYCSLIGHYSYENIQKWKFLYSPRTLATTEIEFLSTKKKDSVLKNGYSICFLCILNLIS